MKTVVFDKTGTLTKGEMMLTDMVAVGPAADGSGVVAADDETLDEDAVLRYAVLAERNGEHPPACTIVAGVADHGLDLAEPDDFENIPGHGIRATVDGKPIPVGNRKLPSSVGVDPAPAEDALRDLEEEGRTVILVAVDGDLADVVADANEIKESAAEAVAALRDRGATVHMITGDSERTARIVAERVGINPDSVSVGVLPEGKTGAVKSLQADDMRVTMVGDGINDMPVLTAAYVGTALGSGTNMVIEAANVTFMRDNPLDAVKAIRISVGTLAKIKQNLFWAFGYNTAMIPLASLGPLQPVLAAGAMALSSVSVLMNSLLFRSYTPDHDHRFLDFLRR